MQQASRAHAGERKRRKKDHAGSIRSRCQEGAEEIGRDTSESKERRKEEKRVHNLHSSFQQQPAHVRGGKKKSSSRLTSPDK